jgi:hypothetical protein
MPVGMQERRFRKSSEYRQAQQDGKGRAHRISAYITNGDWSAANGCGEVAGGRSSLADGLLCDRKAFFWGGTR